MADSITLTRDGISATVRVGDVVPIVGGGTGRVSDIDTRMAESGAVRLVLSGNVPGATSSWFYLDGRSNVECFGVPAIDIAALARAAAAPSPDVAAIEEAAYKRGWNDREDDLIAGVERIVPPEHRQPAAPSEAALRALVEKWRTEAKGIDAFPYGGRAYALEQAAADLAALLDGGKRG